MILLHFSLSTAIKSMKRLINNKIHGITSSSSSLWKWIFELEFSLIQVLLETSSLQKMEIFRCRLLIFWLPLWFVISCHEALTNQKIMPIQSEAMPVVLKVATIRTKVVTNEWNTWSFWRVFYKWFLNLIKRYVRCTWSEKSMKIQLLTR